MIEYTTQDERDSNARSFRITVFKMRIGDGIAVNEDRAALAEKYAGNDTLLVSMYAYPLLKHASTYEVGDSPDTLTKTEFTEAEFLKLPEELAEQWSEAVLTMNPQHGLSQLDYLKNVLAALPTKNSSTENSESG